MKHLFLFFSICVLGAFCSCSDNDTLEESYGNSKIFLTPDEYISIAYDSNKDLGNNGVLEMVKGFNLTQTSRSALGETPKITKKYNLTFNFNGKESKLISVPIYEVKLNGNSNEGYALVSGDERVPAVIAYVDNGTINDTIVNKGAALMIREAKNALLKKVNEIESIKDSLRSATLAKISIVTGKKNITLEDIHDKIEVKGINTRSTATESPSGGKLVKEVIPLITTQWNQNAPYNNLMEKSETDLGWGYNGKNAVGCTAVAVAQIVAYYECLSSAYGLSLNWNSLKASSRISAYGDASLITQVASLFKHVAYGINTTWSNGEGGANMKNASNYLNNLGITFDTGSKYAGYSMDAARIVESLDNLCPVFITGGVEAGTRSTSGGRHCWLLDGYQLRLRSATTRMVVKQNDVYVHANFGWGGHEDGYYMVDRNTTNLDFETSVNGHFNQDLKLFTNIRRK